MEKIYTEYVKMKDGSIRTIESTRSEMVEYLSTHRRKKMICDDTDELFERYVHVMTNLYNKEHPKPKVARGGARPNAGRKKKDASGTKLIGVRVPVSHWHLILDFTPNVSEFVCDAIREKLRRHDLL